LASPQAQKKKEKKMQRTQQVHFKKLFILFIFVVLGLELGAYTFSHSTSPFL
jgi:uncharacterized membrane protein YfcA